VLPTVPQASRRRASLNYSRPVSRMSAREASIPALGNMSERRLAVAHGTYQGKRLAGVHSHLCSLFIKMTTERQDAIHYMCRGAPPSIIELNEHYGVPFSREQEGKNLPALWRLVSTTGRWTSKRCASLIELDMLSCCTVGTCVTCHFFIEQPLDLIVKDGTCRGACYQYGRQIHRSGLS
jgi:hypothetical protein